MGGQMKLRVLVVDDQALVRAALSALLASTDSVEVIGTAGTLDDAHRLAEEHKPDLVLLDVLTDVPAFEWAATLNRRWPDTKVVFLDEAPLDIHAREALRINAAGYLTKQQPFNQLENALRQAAQGDRVYAPEIARGLILSSDGVRLAMERKEHPLANLTPRETDVLIYLAQGNSVKQCAKALGIGVSTVGNHKSRLMKKLNVHKTVELARFAMREGLVPAGRSAPLVPMPEPALRTG